MADETTTVETPEPEETTETPAADEAVVEETTPEAPAADPEPEPEPEAAAAETPAAEPEAAEPEAAEPETEAAEAPAPEPEPEPKRPKKRLPRRLRPQRSKPVRERAAKRKPIVRTTKPESEPGRRQERRGVVVSDKGDKTIVVKVQLISAHPKYKKVVRRSRKFHAHDEQNQAGIGDVVRIVETRPLSKLKNWRLAEVVQKAR